MMKDVTATNIRIERAKLKELKRRALEENRSLASLIRGIIDRYLGLEREGRDKRDLAARQKRAARKWAGTSLGKGFSGRDHDEVLYGLDGKES